MQYVKIGAVALALGLVVLGAVKYVPPLVRKVPGLGE